MVEGACGRSRQAGAARRKRREEERNDKNGFAQEQNADEALSTLPPNMLSLNIPSIFYASIDSRAAILY
jgi:hypothetical protein